MPDLPWQSAWLCSRLCAVCPPTRFHLPVQAPYAARRGPRNWSGVDSPKLIGRKPSRKPWGSLHRNRQLLQCPPHRHRPGFDLEERCVVLAPLNSVVQQVLGLLPRPEGLLLPVQVLESSSVSLRVVPRWRQSPTPCMLGHVRFSDLMYRGPVAVRCSWPLPVVAVEAAVLLPYEPSKHLDKSGVSKADRQDRQHVSKRHRLP
jgi:hypothetical protein